MGVLKFRLSPPDLATRIPDLRKAYATGLDRTPGRVTVDLRPGSLVLHRDTPESGRVAVPWPIQGFGEPFVSTSTLAERPAAYDLGVELARGKLNDVRNQTADWRQMGLSVSPETTQSLDRSRIAFARAATSRDVPEESAAAAARSLEASCSAAELLVNSYTVQVLRKRQEHAAKLPTLLSCGLEGNPKTEPWGQSIADAFNAARVRCAWSRVAPDEGKFRWEESDAQVVWARKRGLAVSAGPLIELRAGAIPDWLWLWQGDFDEILNQATDFVRQAVARYKGKIAVWHLIHRVAGHEILGLSEEEQIRLTATLLQAARRVDGTAHFVVDFDRPWAEWMANGDFQLGPLHLADSLARAELGLAGIGLEVAPGYSGHGSHLRDLLDFSRMLDLFALVNLPLHVTLALPSAATPDPRGDDSGRVAANQWPQPPNEALQKAMAASWVALAVAKPFVRSVTWSQLSDAAPHIFEHAGLLRPDGAAKPVLKWLREFREKTLA